jgi:hypothetical protein
MVFFFSCTCPLWSTYQPLHEVVPGDPRMAWRIGGKRAQSDNTNPTQPTAPDNLFVRVIMMLRKTFIQDSLLMMELHPCHPIWQHSVFSDPAYLLFKRQVNIIALECSSMVTLICQGSAAYWSSGTRSCPHTPPTTCAYAL